MINAILTKEKVRELFNYDPESGLLTRRIRTGMNTKIGKEAGHLNKKHKYRYVEYMYKAYLVHRVIWLWWYGEWPKDEIDHINGDGVDNRIENLRGVTHVENGKNQKFRSHNTSGVMGVRRHGGKWQACINANGRRLSLGHFVELADAILARKMGEKKYGFHQNHGRRS